MNSRSLCIFTFLVTLQAVLSADEFHTVWSPDEYETFWSADEYETAWSSDAPQVVLPQDESPSFWSPDESLAAWSQDEPPSFWSPDESQAVCSPGEPLAVLSQDEPPSVLFPDEYHAVWTPDEYETFWSADEYETAWSPDKQAVMCQDESPSFWSPDEPLAVLSADKCQPVLSADESPSLWSPDEFQFGMSVAKSKDPILKVSHKGIYFLSLRRVEGSAIGERSSYTTLEALSFPFGYRCFCPFVDLRYHGFGESGQNAANAGLGCRFAPNFADVILGANIYYDYRNSHNHPYNQIGIGFESLGARLNIRVNGYLPVGKKSRFRSSKIWAEYSGGYFIIRRKFTDSYKGFDFEAEVLATTICCTDIYFAIGGYFYEERKCGMNVLGSEYRLTVNPYGCLSCSVSATYDYCYKTRVQGEITFRIPFGCGCNAETYSAWFQPVRRREMMVLDSRDMYRWNW